MKRLRGTIVDARGRVKREDRLDRRRVCYKGPKVRIIAGLARGRRLVAPKGMDTRPTPDRVKESLFSILGPRVDGALVLDLFAGTGALGLEALSRGAAGAWFVEPDRAARAALEDNIEKTRLGPTEVLPMPAVRAIKKLAAAGRQFDLVFIDPPFAQNAWDEALRELCGAGLLLPHGLVVCEHPSHGPAPKAPAGIAQVDTRAFGDVSLTFLANAKGP